MEENLNITNTLYKDLIDAYRKSIEGEIDFDRIDLICEACGYIREIRIIPFKEEKVYNGFYIKFDSTKNVDNPSFDFSPFEGPEKYKDGIQEFLDENWKELKKQFKIGKTTIEINQKKEENLNDANKLYKDLLNEYKKSIEGKVIFYEIILECKKGYDEGKKTNCRFIEIIAKNNENCIVDRVIIKIFDSDELENFYENNSKIPFLISEQQYKNLNMFVFEKFKLLKKYFELGKRLNFMK